jgi:NAD(P)-dependent dehydrogenase (short-subunit alcohol dehydrogenase family)
MAEYFENKIAIVTGGGSGIGQTCALTFAGAGAKVVVADVQAEGGNETVALINGNGGEATFVKTDVAVAKDVEALISRTVATYGGLDIAYNNAGIEPPVAKVADIVEEDWDNVIRINMKSIWLCMKYEIKAMLERGGGAIVNMASVVGFLGQPEMASYVAGKHAVLGLTRTAALEYVADNIRVNAVCPAIVDTPMVERFTKGDAEVVAALTAQYPIKRLLDPQEVADAVLWLCSDKASYLNGHSLVMDGGFSIQ